MKRGKSVYINNVIIKHEHPMNTNTAKMDASYQKTLAYYAEDKLTFERRKAMNFGLDEVKEVVKNKGGRPKKVVA